MGLYIYYHRVKNKEAYLMYSKSVDVFREFEDRYYKAHKEVFDKDWAVWEKWHDELNDSDLDYDEFIKSNPEPHFYYWDYLTEEQRKEYERLSDKKYSIGQTLTYGEESMFKALKRIKEQDRRDEQKRLRESACTKIQTALGLAYDELVAFCDWIKR